MVSYFQDNETTLKNFANPALVSEAQVRELDAEAQNLDGKGGVIKVMPAVRLGWRGWGFQLYSNAEAAPMLDNGVFQPRINGDALVDIA